MYQDSDNDPVVRLYDEVFGITGESELAWYMDKVKRFGSPVLDMACGTGRMTLKFVELGYEVVGIDSSQGMLSKFEHKIAKLDDNLQNNIRIFNASMSNFHMDQHFNTVLCVDAFFHNLTDAEERGCLENICNHLSSNGRAFFNVHNLNNDFIEWCRHSDGKNYHKRGEFPIADDITIICKEANRIEETRQIVHCFLKFEYLDPEGTQIKVENSEWKKRYHSQEQYENMIEKAGLTVEQVVGTYRDGPVTEKSQLIYQLKKGKR